MLDDPGEARNLAPDRPGQVRQLEARLDQLVAELGNEGAEEQAPETLDEATRAQLAALGYLGGSSRVRVNEDEPLADPKDKIVLYNLLKAAGTDSN